MYPRYLVSVPACHSVLSPVYALLEARTINYNSVLQLRGKLEMLTKQASEAAAEHHIDVDKEPLIGEEDRQRLKQLKLQFFIPVYEDESSDEGDDLMEDLMINGDENDEDIASFNSEEDSEEDNEDQMSESD